MAPSSASWARVRDPAAETSAQSLARLAALAGMLVLLALPVHLDGQQPQNPGAGAARIRLMPELSIGVDTGAAEYEFAGVGLVAVGGSGNVFVSAWDGRDVSIRKFDHAGRFVGRIGRGGSGPGEYRSVNGIAIVDDSLLVVLDRGNGRVVLFDTGGAYRSSFLVAGTYTLKEFFAFTDGTIAVRARVGGPSGRNAEPGQYGFIHYRLDGQVIDTIGAPSDNLQSRVMVVRGLGWRWPFTRTTVFALLPRGGIATAVTTVYRVQVASAGGRSLVIERAAPRIPLHGQERREWEELQATSLPEARSPLPRWKPFIRDLFADEEGRIWVELYTEAAPRVPQPRLGAQRQPEMTLFENNAYDVFDQGGRYLGRLDLPPFSRLVAVRGDRVWLSEEADSGFYVVTRCRMQMTRQPS